MSMQDDDVQKQLKQMVAFIEQEANDTIEQIYAKTEEEVNIEKRRIVQEERNKIDQLYNGKMNALTRELKRDEVNLLSNSRIELASGRQRIYDEILAEARRRVEHRTKKPRRYARILFKLLLEALLLAIEPDVVVRCRENDVRIVKAILPLAVEEYTLISGLELRANMDDEKYLPASDAGGVAIIAKQGRIRVENTLDSRFNQVCDKLSPKIRAALFGVNLNRKFLD